MAQSVLIRKWSYVARLPLWMPPPVKVRQSILNRLVRSGLEGLRFGKVTLGGVCGGRICQGWCLCEGSEWETQANRTSEPFLVRCQCRGRFPSLKWGRRTKRDFRGTFYEHRDCEEDKGTG